MNYIEIFNNYNGEVLEIELVKDFIDFCVEKLNLKNVMFNVIIVDNETIRDINKEYRGIDRKTDVISFALEDDKSFDDDISVRVLGDIYISYDKVLEQAKEYGHSVKREICFLAIHGLLHLLGFDHMNKDDEEKMFKIQKEMLLEYGIKKES